MHTSLLTFHKHRNHPSIFVWCILYVLGELYNFSEIFLILNEEASTSTCMYNIYAMSNMSKYIYMLTCWLCSFTCITCYFACFTCLFTCFACSFTCSTCSFAWSNMFDMVFYMFIHGWHVLWHVPACTWYSMDIILLISTQRILKIGSSRLRHANMTCIHCKHNIYMNMNKIYACYIYSGLPWT